MSQSIGLMQFDTEMLQTCLTLCANATSSRVLTELGRDQGCVAFQPSAFYGRFVGELVYSLNDALRRLEGLTSYYVMSGDGKTLQTYYAELENGLGRIGKDLDGIVGFCKRKLAQD